MFRSLSIRAKLTLSYLTVTALALFLFGFGSLGVLRYTLAHLKQATMIRREQRLYQFLGENLRTQNAASITEQLQSYATATHEGNLFQVRKLNGEVVFPLSRKEASWLTSPQTDCATTSFEDIQVDNQPVSVMCHQNLLADAPVRIYIGSSLEDQVNILSAYRGALFLLLPCILTLAAISGFFVSRGAMRSVDQMTKAAVDIGVGNLSARLPLPQARDELRSLAIAWNQLLDRLEGAVSRLSRFSADASHDLRTSITVILATAQLSLHRRRTEGEYRENLDRIVDECRTASTLLDALLSLARSDNFVHEVAFKAINVGDLAVSGCRRVEDLAEAGGIVLDWRIPPANVFVQGDELLLQRLLGILLDNAIKYTPEDGEILVEVAAADTGIAVVVRDTGIGMTAEVREHVFDRFYQADLREHKYRAGNGLGLAIARWIAEAHHAELSVTSSPMRGSEFQIRFPVASTALPTIAMEPAHASQSR